MSVSITLLNDRLYAWLCLEGIRNTFDTIVHGKVCSCARAFNYLHMLPIDDTTRSPKNGKIGGYPPPECNRINRLRQNLACKHRPWVYSSILNFALITKGAGYRSPQMSTFAQNCIFRSWKVTINGFKWNLACKHGPWVCCLLANLTHIGKGDGHKSPTKCEILVIITIFRQFFCPTWRCNTSLLN